MSLPVAILISGTGTNMAALLADMARPGHPARPVLVIASDPAAGGIEKARAAGVPVAVIARRDHDRAGFEAAIAAALDRAGARLICLAGFMHILSPGFVGPRAGRILNIHPSLLPKYPGLETHARALAAGEREHGCTVHEVTGALDAGPVLGRGRVPVLEGDTPGRLAVRVRAMEHRLYPAVLRRVAAGERGVLDLS